MVRLFVFLAAVELVLVVLALISVLSVDRVRNLPRFLWVLVIFVIPILGAITYFLTGRPMTAPVEGAPRRAAPPPSSPDDDADFLRKVDTEQSRRDRELLAQWERELQNGEEEK